MERTRFWRIGLVLLIVIVAVAAIGGGIQRKAWMQGYMMGQLSSGGEGQTVAPLMAYGYPSGGHSFLPVLLGVGLVVGLMFMAGKVMFFHSWKKAGGRPPEEWRKFWERHHDHMPPWCWHEEAPAAAEGEKPAAEKEAEE